VEPNPELLQNAMDQTLGKNKLKAPDWKRQILKRLDALDCDALKKDAAPFLEHFEDAELFSVENFRSLLCE
jgi:hypothetical protein